MWEKFETHHFTYRPTAWPTVDFSMNHPPPPPVSLVGIWKVIITESQHKQKKIQFKQNSIHVHRIITYTAMLWFGWQVIAVYSSRGIFYRKLGPVRMKPFYNGQLRSMKTTNSLFHISQLIKQSEVTIDIIYHAPTVISGTYRIMYYVYK